MGRVERLLKRCKSRKQMLAELKKAEHAFNEEQAMDIAARLADAAARMGDKVPELPCLKD